ncbi:MAG: tyrosine-type recombinase/integrase [Rhodospirillaceae bacterium]|nr:tyrosine-type recombinase/integrase [Rhodospirillaceae bacterium]
MLFRLVRPMKRPESSKVQFVQRIPRDVLPMVRGMSLAIPVGDHVVTRRVTERAEVVKLSLGTNDPSEAKIRQASVAAHLEGVWRAVRNGPAQLSHRQAVSLAGDAYREIVGTFEEYPRTPEFWQRHRGYLGEAQQVGASEEARSASRIETLFGGFADKALTNRGLIVDADSRWRLLVEIARVMDLSSEQLERYAFGDYSPDQNTSRFPAFQMHTEQPAPGAPAAPGGTPFPELLEAWWQEARATGKTISTYNSYRHSLELLAAFLGHDDASRVGPENVIAFKDHRLTQVNPRTGKSISAKTVKDSDLAALKSVFGWACTNRRLAANPAEGVTIKVGRSTRTRDPSFSQEEARALLSAATNHHGGEKENPQTAAAKRWVPWLCAYSGARVGEIAQLRKEDIRQQEGHWVMSITPDAGTVKTKQARIVPLHPHLIEQGFLGFVVQSTAGHLFLKVGAGEDFRGRWQALKNRLQEFARTVVSDPAVQPNHGWRHAFKTIGLEAGIEGRVLDAIQGHAPRTEGETYGSVSLTARVRAMERFPRFGL